MESSPPTLSALYLSAPALALALFTYTLLKLKLQRNQRLRKTNLNLTRTGWTILAALISLSILVGCIALTRPETMSRRGRAMGAGRALLVFFVGIPVLHLTSGTGGARRLRCSNLLNATYTATLIALLSGATLLPLLVACKPTLQTHIPHPLAPAVLLAFTLLAMPKVVYALITLPGSQSVSASGSNSNHSSNTTSSESQLKSKAKPKRSNSRNAARLWKTKTSSIVLPKDILLTSAIAPQPPAFNADFGFDPAINIANVTVVEAATTLRSFRFPPPPPPPPPASHSHLSVLGLMARTRNGNGNTTSGGIRSSFHSFLPPPPPLHQTQTIRLPLATIPGTPTNLSGRPSTSSLESTDSINTTLSQSQSQSQSHCAKITPSQAHQCPAPSQLQLKSTSTTGSAVGGWLSSISLGAGIGKAHAHGEEAGTARRPITIHVDVERRRTEETCVGSGGGFGIAGCAAGCTDAGVDGDGGYMDGWGDGVWNDEWEKRHGHGHGHGRGASTSKNVPVIEIRTPVGEGHPLALGEIKIEDNSRSASNAHIHAQDRDADREMEMEMDVETELDMFKYPYTTPAGLAPNDDMTMGMDISYEEEGEPRKFVVALPFALPAPTPASNRHSGLGIGQALNRFSGMNQSQSQSQSQSQAQRSRFSTGPDEVVEGEGRSTGGDVALGTLALVYARICLWKSGRIRHVGALTRPESLPYTVIPEDMPLTNHPNFVSPANFDQMHQALFEDPGGWHVIPIWRAWSRG